MSAASDQALDDLGTQVTAMTNAASAAITVLNGFAARVDAAVAKALADNSGITPTQLSGITAETASLKQAAGDLGAAIVANTPAG